MHVAVLAAYVLVALAFAWPLPLHLGTQLPGPVSQDTGVYVWNLWVFRHEIVQHHHLPFATLEIMSLASPVPLAMHNYTAIADILAFPLLPLLGTVRTFNVLIIASGVLSAYVMFLFARRVTGDAGASWLAGLLFGFSPFMSARTSEHFSLVQTAPLVVCALLIDRFKTVRSIGLGVALGITVAVAYLCDPYYAVYCLMMIGFAIVSSAIVVRDPDPARFPWRGVVIGSNAIIAGLAALVVWIASRRRFVPGARRTLALAGVVAIVAGGVVAVRGDTLADFVRFLGIRGHQQPVGVESYSQRTVLAYIGLRIFEDHPVAGVGWLRSSRPDVFEPYLEDAHRRFPDVVDLAFPAAGREWGIQNLYIQMAADAGIVGLVLLLLVGAVGLTLAWRGATRAPTPWAAGAGLLVLCALLTVAGEWSSQGIVPGIPLQAASCLLLGLAAAGAASTETAR